MQTQRQNKHRYTKADLSADIDAINASGILPPEHILICDGTYFEVVREHGYTVWQQQIRTPQQNFNVRRAIETFDEFNMLYKAWETFIDCEVVATPQPTYTEVRTKTRLDGWRYDGHGYSILKQGCGVGTILNNICPDNCPVWKIARHISIALLLGDEHAISWQPLA